MMKNYRAWGIIGVASFLLVGCVSTDSGMSNNQLAGTGIGMTGGAVAGALIAREAGVNPLVGALIGGVAGGIVGNVIGSALDENERKQLMIATQQAAMAPVGRKVSWDAAPKVPKKTKPLPPTTSPSQKNTAQDSAPEVHAASGWAIPVTEEYVANNGETCRDIQQHAEKSGQTYEQKVTACKTPSGWEIPS